jgi:hypothetical protein
MSFNEELFNKVATEFALPETLKSAILGKDGLPEDFDFTESFKSYTDEREGFYADKLRPGILAHYKENEGKDQFIATIKPIANKIIKDYELTAEEIGENGLNPKELISIARSKMENRLKEQSTKGTAAIAEELTETKTKYGELFEEYNKFKDQHVIELNNAKAEKENAIKEFKIDQAFLALIDDEAFKWSNSKSNIQKWLRKEILDRGYKVDFTPTETGLMIYAADGTKAFTLDGKSQYSDIKTAIFDFGDHLNLFVKSNGNQGGEGATVTGKINGKPVSKASVNWLAEQVA